MFKRFQEQSFQAGTEKKVVYVYVNGKFTDVNVDGKTMFLEMNWGLEGILSNASKRLEIPTAKRLFNADGIEIDDVMMIQDEDMLFLSSGEEFVPKPPSYTATSGPDRTLAAELDINRNQNQSDSGGIDDKYASKTDNLPPVIGNYKVSTFLGRGGFGIVRVGRHQLTDERVALKFINKSDILSIAAAERTMTEIQCLTTLKHSNIILLYEYVETLNHVVLMFELMEGGDLLSYLKSQDRGARADGVATDGDILGAGSMVALPEEDARTVFYQTISAVSFAHNHHICHRDLKLENILLKIKGSIEMVKVADFGLSDFYRPGSVRKSNCGTLAFLAPEGFKNTANAGPPLDVWSLGVILFALLFGRLPFDVDSTDRRDVVEKEAKSPGVGFGRYDLEDRDKDSARREDTGRPLFGTGASDRKRHGSKQQPLLHQEEEDTKESARSAKKAPRPDQIIRNKILKCQYSFDLPGRNMTSGEGQRPVSVEAKDLIRRMLVLEPEERATVPEIFSHIWTRSGLRNHHNHSAPRRKSDTGKNVGNRPRVFSTDSNFTDDGESDSSIPISTGADLPAPAASPPQRKTGVPVPLTRQQSNEFLVLSRERDQISKLDKYGVDFEGISGDMERGGRSSPRSGVGAGEDGRSSRTRDVVSPLGPAELRTTSRGGSRRDRLSQLGEESQAATINTSTDTLAPVGFVLSALSSESDALGTELGKVRSLQKPDTDATLAPASGRRPSAPTLLRVTSPISSGRNASLTLAGAATISSTTTAAAIGTGPGTAENSPTPSGSMLMPLRRNPKNDTKFEDEQFIKSLTDNASDGRPKVSGEDDSLALLLGTPKTFARKFM